MTEQNIVVVSDAVAILTNVADTGDYEEDCATGRRLAEQMLKLIRNGSAIPSLLSHVTRALVERGAYGAVQIGFFTRIAYRAAA